MSNNIVTTQTGAPLKGRKKSQAASDPQAAKPDQVDTHEVHDKDRGSVGRLLRYGSVIPSIGGGFEALYGVKELREAQELKAAGDPSAKLKTRDGKVDLVRGSSSLVAGVTHLPMYLQQYGLLSMKFGLFAALGLIGGIASAIDVAFDGGRDVYNGFKYHNKSDIGYGGVKVFAGALEVIGSLTLNVPMMLASNAIFAVAAGVQNRHALAKIAKKVGHKVADGIQKVLPGHHDEAKGTPALPPGTDVKLLPEHVEQPENALATEPSPAPEASGS